MNPYFYAQIWLAIITITLFGGSISVKNPVVAQKMQGAGFAAALTAIFVLPLIVFLGNL